MKIYRVRITIETEDFIAANSEEDAREVLSDHIEAMLENPDEHCTDLRVVREVHEFDREVVPYTAAGTEEKTLAQWLDDGEPDDDNFVDPRQIDLCLGGQGE